MDELEARLARFTHQLDTIDGRSSEDSRTLTRVQAGVSALSLAVGLVASDTGTLKSDVSALKAEQTVIRTEVETIRTEQARQGTVLDAILRKLP